MIRVGITLHNRQNQTQGSADVLNLGHLGLWPRFSSQAILWDKKQARVKERIDDRSKKGPPEVPHREGALGDLWATDFEGGSGPWIAFFEGVRAGWRGTYKAYFWRRAVFFWRVGWPGQGKLTRQNLVNFSGGGGVRKWPWLPLRCIISLELMRDPTSIGLWICESERMTITLHNCFRVYLN